MAHKFDRSKRDPYVESARQVERNVFSSHGGLVSGAQEQMYDVLSNVIVTALGDIAAQAFRNGVSQPQQIKALAKAVAGSCEAVFESYAGEVDPEPALQALEDDTRQQSLTPVAQDKLKREIQKTRQIEALQLTAKRLPDLFDFAGSLGLRLQDDLMEQGTLLVGEHPTPNAEEQIRDST